MVTLGQATNTTVGRPMRTNRSTETPKGESEHVKNSKEELNRSYDRLLSEAVCLFVFVIGALLAVFFVLHLLNLLP